MKDIIPDLENILLSTRTTVFQPVVTGPLFFNYSLFFINNDRFKTRYGPTDKVGCINFYVKQHIIDVSEETGANAKSVKSTGAWVFYNKYRSPYIYFYTLVPLVCSNLRRCL